MKDLQNLGDKNAAAYKDYRHIVFLYFVAWSLLLVATSGAEPVFRFGYAKNFMGDVEGRDAQAAFDIFIKEFGKHNDYRIDRTIYDDGPTTIDTIVNNRLDFATLRLPTYAGSKHRQSLELAVTRHPSAKVAQRQMLLVRNDGPVQRLQDLSGRRLVIPRQVGMGMIFMNYLLSKNRLPEAEHFFSSLAIKDKSSEAIHEVFFGQAGACLVSESVYDMAVSLNQQIGERLKVIAASPALVENVSVFRKGCPQNQNQQLLDLIMSSRNTVRGKQFLTFLRCEDIVSITETDLTETLLFMQASGRMKEKRQ